MTAGWDRLEGVVRSEDLTGGLQARIADPLWMIAQQRRVGEFLGDDAAEPIAIRVRARHTRLASFRAGYADSATAFSGTKPWETVVEASPEPDFGSAGLFAAARAGHQLARMLRSHGHTQAIDVLRQRFPLKAVDAVATGPSAAADLLARRGLDGIAIADADEAQLGLDSAALAVVGRWRDWLSARSPSRDSKSWSDERMEYACSLSAATAQGEMVLVVPEHDGGSLDWFSCDLSTDQADGHGLAAADASTVTVTSLPTPVRYRGMPASRWFEFEDGGVNFGDIEAGPADLARLLVAEYATVFSNDWFMVPLRIPSGSLAQLVEVELIDTFGGRVSAPSVARMDFDRVGAARAWRMFELTGDEMRDGQSAPWLYVPPSLASTVEGPALERVAFTRDEAANLAWGIEQLIEGPLGRPVDRASIWHARPAPASSTLEKQAVDGLWRYQLGGQAPPWWIPFIAERVDPASSPEVRLRRSRLQSWAELDSAELTGPQSQLLDPRRPRWLFEEEVPRGGVRVERRWQAARWHDGSLHVWLQRRKRSGRADRGSGLRWDILNRGTGSAHEGH